MKKLSVLFAIVALLVVNCSRYNGQPEQATASEKKGQDLHKIYVEDIKPLAASSKNDKVELRVSGNLPSAAYKLNRVDVQVKGSVIEVTPLADFDGTKMAAQVLIPFEEKVTVNNLKPGTYEVKVLGRGEPIIAQNKVVVRQ